MFKIILGWIQQHVAATIIISVVVIGSAVTTSVILLNGKDESKFIVETKEDDKQDQEQEPEELQEPKLNEDGCPVGFFLNYYGICQNEHLYEPQECPDGYEWLPNAYVNKDNGDGTVSPDYEATYGIDGLPKGDCGMTYETYCASLANNPNAVPCSTTKYGLEEKESFEHRGICGRGWFWNSETNTCLDNTAWERSVYEERVLSKHDPKEDLPKCSERSEKDQACLKD